VHFARDIDPESALGVLDKPQLQTRRVRPFGLHYLGFHLGSDLFKQPDVRRAFREAIDFQEIQSETGLEPAKGPIPAGVEAYDSSLPTPGRGDTGKALKHTCGATIGNIEIPLLFNVNSYYGKELAERIEHDVTPSGLKIKRDPKGTSSDLLKEIEQRRKKPDPYVFIYNWYSILPAAELFLRPLFEGKRFANEERMPDNLTGYAEAPFDDLLAAARKPGISLQDRIKHYQEAQKKVVDDVPAIFLGHSRVRYSVHSTKVRGLKLNVQSFPVDRYVGVDVL
jgi:ABC-type transport system substrate-binding protein